MIAPTPVTPDMVDFINTISIDCGCGKRHEGAAWLALPYIGLMCEDTYPLELRNCTCGSTKALALCSDIEPIASTR